MQAQESLAGWIEENRANDAEVSIAMPEAAFGSLLGPRVGPSATRGNISTFSTITMNPTIDAAAAAA
jgi:hypothetical protein